MLQEHITELGIKCLKIVTVDHGNNYIIKKYHLIK